MLILFLRNFFSRLSVFLLDFNVTLKKSGARALQISEMQNFLNFVSLGLLHSCAYIYEQFVFCFWGGLATELFALNATELFTGMELHIRACKPNEAELWTKKYKKQLVFLLKSGFSAEKEFHREHRSTLLQTGILLSWKKVFDDNRVPPSFRAP